jgi:anti-anti-sigma factor
LRINLSKVPVAGRLLSRAICRNLPRGISIVVNPRSSAALIRRVPGSARRCRLVEQQLMNTDPLSLSESQHGDLTVLSVVGRIDSSNAAKLTQHTDLIATGVKTVLIDFTAVKYLTSAAFRVLLVANGSLKEKGGQLALCGVTGHVRELFEMGGLLQAFTIFQSREEAFGKLT